MPEKTEALLRRLGPALTTKHIAELVKAGISEPTARKRVQWELRTTKNLQASALKRTPVSSIALRTLAMQSFGSISKRPSTRMAKATGLPL